MKTVNQTIQLIPRMFCQSMNIPSALSSYTRKVCSLEINLVNVSQKMVKIYKSIILPDVLHGCEAWFLTLST
jgi:hypothetical protein